MPAYEDVLRDALRTHGLSLLWVELADDAAWDRCQQVVCWIEHEDVPIADPVVDGDLDSPEYMRQIAKNVARRVQRRQRARVEAEGVAR